MKKLLGFIMFLITSFCFVTIVQAQDYLNGIDVSKWQGNIDFNEVKKSGIEVVYMRSSVGNTYVDPFFRQNYNRAKANNLKVGIYHFVMARNTEEAISEARFFVSVIEGLQPDCRLAMDFETLTDLSKEEINEISEAFLRTVRELSGKEVVVYSDAYNANNVFDSTLARQYPLWIAQYGVNRPTSTNWSNWIGWQYSDVGRVSGISGNVDRDYYTSDILLNDQKEIPAVKPSTNEKENTKTIKVQVKKGDTLTKIAKKHDVKVSDITKWNDIKNPDLIHENQVIKIHKDFKYQINEETQAKIHKVKCGDTLSQIALDNQVTVIDLVQWNNIANPDLIYINDEIRIVSKANTNHLISYVVKEGDTLSEIAKRYKTSVSQLVKINKNCNPNLIKINEIIYIPIDIQY